MNSRTWMCIAVATVFVGPVVLYSASRPADTDKALTQLPQPQTRGGMTLAEAIATRRTIRSFGAASLTAEQVGQLCWAAQGITDREQGLRTAPSALKLYAIRVYVIDGAGAYEYIPQSHALQALGIADAPGRIRACIGSEALRAAPVIMILAMEPERLRARCGEKAERFSLLEAGHVCQNVLLQATGLGLAAVPVGGLDEAKAAEALGLPEGVRPVYAIPVGEVKSAK